MTRPEGQISTLMLHSPKTPNTKFATSNLEKPKKTSPLIGIPTCKLMSPQPRV